MKVRDGDATTDGAASPADWVVEWFRRRGAPIDNDAGMRSDNYFEAGWIDSLGVVELIADIEEHFGIRFGQRHFQDRRFATINGLGEILGEIQPRADDVAL